MHFTSNHSIHTMKKHFITVTVNTMLLLTDSKANSFPAQNLQRSHVHFNSNTYTQTLKQHIVTASVNTLALWTESTVNSFEVTICTADSG